MNTRILHSILLLIYCFYISSCVAVRQPKSWRYRQLGSETESTRPFIGINLKKSTTLLPIPLIIWEVGSSRNYLLDIDFHTENIEYKQLDSIRYEIQNLDKEVLASGTLPIINGELSRRSYSPEVHRAQCTTQPIIALGNQRQELIGTFTIYATDAKGQKALVLVESVALHYFKARFGSFF
ncbi:hypothetical protein MUN82_09410 [Hymenobacter aerilatus]|uniref:Uncharacterized protein n=1 Tax=Hymenobacter aerilatus TaxID=2932251 RepID=A0A8T9T3W4_9BACT|nr:hypothetical protein [Hymenobacter aerilatus]UOR07300.1 hypothetical protein MUN82_09410 [Hymenobacter aerilatus]